MSHAPVAVDAMGGDHAPDAVVEGVIRAARLGVPVLLVGDETILGRMLPRDLKIPILHAAEAVAMGESPAVAVRKKAASSIRLTMRAVAEGQAGAALSCGNTGAAMAAALLELGRIPGVERPAITTVVPRIDGGKLVILDLGANVDCRPSHLGQFAVMGHLFARHVLGIADPAVGILSNGEESGKGNELVRAAVPFLESAPIRFVGHVEPTAAFRGAVDVLVCDGFVGNVMLKSVEATVEVVGSLLKEEILRHQPAKLGAWLLKGAFRRYRKRTEYAAIGGAQLLGVNGVVIVGHGRADAEAVASAIRLAHHSAQEGLSTRIAQSLQKEAESSG